ncbi:MAG: hypothetical protein M5R42_14480 [Rhodocyclaceae bacterium]|nr:hypothetical protein [Rhodocyclaceae bacterium]
MQKTTLDEADKRRIRRIVGFFAGRDEDRDNAETLRAGGRRVLAPARSRSMTAVIWPSSAGCASCPASASPASAAGTGGSCWPSSSLPRAAANAIDCASAGASTA